MTKSTILTVPLLLIACSSEAPERYEAPARLHLSSDAVADSFGHMVNGGAQVSLVRSAALSSSGRFLAVGDYHPSPFIHLLDRVTGSVVGFGQKGDGPGEFRNVYELEFLSDSVLLVLGAGGRLEQYNIDGEWLGGYRDSRAGITIASITSGCGGRVYAYGIERAELRSTRDSLPWVHELFLGTELTSAARLTLPIPASRIAWGRLYGFHGTDEGIMLWDRDAMTGYWLPCDEAEPHVWHRGASADVTMSAVATGMALRLPDTLFAGAVAHRTEKYMARKWKETGTDITALRKVTEEGCSEVELIGPWTIRDAHPDGLVLGTEAPYPSVKIVSWDWLNAQFRRTRCG